MIMYSSTSKLNSTFGTIGKVMATAVRFVRALVYRTGPANPPVLQATPL